MPAQDTLELELFLAGAMTTGVKTAAGATLICPCNLQVVGALVFVGTAPTTTSAIFSVQRTRLADGTTSQLWTTASVTDGATTNGSAAITSAGSAFISSTMNGKYVTGTGIPAGTTATFNTTGSMTLSANATATGSGLTLTFTNRPTILATGTNSMVTTGTSPNIVMTKPPVPDTQYLTMGDVLSLNIIQIGSGTAGSDPLMVLSCERT